MPILLTRLRDYVWVAWRKLDWPGRLFLLLQLATLVTCIELWKHLPAPGWSVAILAAVAAAMSINDSMRPWQKVLWMGLIGCLLIVELRSIDNERKESTQKALADRQAQEDSFTSIRHAQEKDFEVTATGLRNAIEGIGRTLAAANTTLEQTEPHAALRVMSVVFNPIPASLAANDYVFDVNFVNDGSDPAQDVRILARVYIAQQGDPVAQQRLATAFEREWNAGGFVIKKGDAPPKVTRKGSFLEHFSSPELSEITSTPTATFYDLVRIEYSDQTGRWRVDDCQALQHGPRGVSVDVTHPCKRFTRLRYKIPSMKFARVRHEGY